MNDSNILEKGIVEIKAERERLLLESLSPVDLQTEMRERGWKEIVLNQRLVFQGGQQRRSDNDSAAEDFEKLCTSLRLNRSIVHMKIEALDPKLSSALFLSVGYIPTLRVLDVTCRAVPSEVATLSLLLNRARSLQRVEIHLLCDRDTRAFVFHEIPDALRDNHPKLCELKIFISACAGSYFVRLDLGNFFTRCARLSSLDCFCFGEETYQTMQLKLIVPTMCSTAMDCLLGSGIRDIRLNGVELLNAQEPMNDQQSLCGENYQRLRRIELSFCVLSLLNRRLFHQVIAHKALKLKEFIVHDIINDVPLQWVRQIAETIGRRDTVEKVKFPGFSAGNPRLGIPLCQLPVSMRGLHELDISDMIISNDIALALSNAISLSSALRVLALRDCSTCVDGSHTLSRCLASDPHLERLTVTGLFNGLPSECKQSFFEMLALNDKLKMLDISKNEFTRNEFFTLVQSLSSGSKLGELKYKEWSGNGSGFLALGRALFSNENDSLTQHTVDGRFCSSIRSEANLVDCQVFGNALQENKFSSKALHYRMSARRCGMRCTSGWPRAERRAQGDRLGWKLIRR